MLLLPLVVPLVVGSTAPAPPPPATTSPRDPTTQQLLPIDPTTGQPLQTDPGTGLLVVPRDPTTGQLLPLVDESGQPIVLRDESGQPIPADDAQLVIPDSLLRPEGRGAGSFDPGELSSRGVTTGGTRYRARLGIVEGFTTNALETQAVLNGPYVMHPAVFTGLEGSIDLLTWSAELDQQDLRIGGRIQHYIPVDGYNQIDDGTLNGSWNGAFTLDRSTVMSAHVIGTFTSSNSALLADGPLFQADPSTLTRVYTIENARIAISHELSKSWRLAVGVDAWLGTTVSEAPVALPSGGFLNHTGLDYVNPDVDVTLNHDFGPSDIGSLILRDTETFSAFVVDYSKNPPTYNGTAWNQAGSLLANWTHGFDEHLRMVLGVGGSVAQAPPLDANQQPVVSPIGSALLAYSRRYWLATAAGSYSYGSTNPRIGFGPSEGGSFLVQGLPFPQGRWARLSVLANGGVSYSTFAQGGGASTALMQASGSVEGRYGVNRWLGVVGGYNASYVDLEGAGALGVTVRNVVYLGLSGYFANDGSIPTLEQFAVGITPPG